MWRIT